MITPGVLNFIGTNLPPDGKSFTGKSVYITGAAYDGRFGVGDSTVTNNTRNTALQQEITDRTNADSLARSKLMILLKIQISLLLIPLKKLLMRSPSILHLQQQLN